MNFKRYIPLWAKKIAWYLVKSPHRKGRFIESLGTDLFAVVSLMRHLAGYRIQDVTICTGIKNRNDNYLNYVLPSILAMKDPDRIEISIYDCGSDDFERLEASIKEKWKGKLVITKGPEQKFERSLTFNRAIRQATNQLVFICDADLSLPPDLVRMCNRNVSRRTTWFPVFFDLKKDKPAEVAPENGKWLPISYGMFACTKEQFETIGGFDESFKVWGGEDYDVFLRFQRAGYLCLRTKVKGLFHHYHPSLNPALSDSAKL